MDGYMYNEWLIPDFLSCKHTFDLRDPILKELTGTTTTAKIHNLVADD
jgi:hypothetical protein